MVVSNDLVGWESPVVAISWLAEEAALYALAVGVAHHDGTTRLRFTTENTTDTPQRVLPAFAATLAQRGWRTPFGGGTAATGLQYSYALDLHRELPAAGAARVTSRIVGVYDAGWAAVIEYDVTVREASHGDMMAMARATSLLKGVKAIGATAWVTERTEMPSSPPDIERAVVTRPDQALLYRLCGDRNPLHSDPVVAVRAGFARPILHGLCTFGIAAQVLLRDVCKDDPAMLQSVSGRFTRRVVPGESLKLSAWCKGARWRFRLSGVSGAPVLQAGEMVVRDHIGSGR